MFSKVSNELHIFDFCGTITTIQTADDFVRFVIKNNPIRVSAYYILKIVQKSLNLFLGKSFISKRHYCLLMRGYSVSFLNSKSNSYARILYDLYLRERIITKINMLIKDGKKVIIVSAGYHNYIRLVANLLEIDEVYASNLTHMGDKISGKFDRTMFGEDKLKFIMSYINQSNYSDIYFYSDSFSDFNCLNLVDFPIVVHPDMDLLQKAIELGWPIVYD